MRIRHTVTALTFALATAGIAQAAPVAVVNGTAIQQNELDSAVSAIVRSGGGRIKDTPELRNEVKQQLINRQVILQESARRGLDKTPQFKERMDAVRDDLLQQALIDDLAKQNPVSDAQVRAEYDKLKSALSGQKEVQARQIIVGSEAEANAVIAQLKKGGNFEAIAKQKSKDPAAKQNGGELGWGNLGVMAKPLADSLKPLGKGQYTQQPFKSDLGWHIFKVENVRDAKVPQFDEVKPQLSRQMQGAAVEKALNDLRGKAKIQ